MRQPTLSPTGIICSRSLSSTGALEGIYETSVKKATFMGIGNPGGNCPWGKITEIAPIATLRLNFRDKKHIQTLIN
jgi:hypothetical protein